MRKSRRISILVIIFLCCVAARRIKADDRPFGPNMRGLMAGVRGIPVGDGTSCDLTYLAIDPANFAVRVEAARPLVAKHSRVQSGLYTTSGLPLTDFQMLSSSVAAISGGYLNSFSPVEALGYVQVDGGVENRRHKSWLVDGVLCTAHGTAQILAPESQSWEDLPGKYEDCLQAGPRIVADGQIVFPRANETEAGALRLAQAEQPQ